MEYVFGVPNATALNVPSVVLSGPCTPLVSSGLRADLSPRALVDRPLTEPQLSLTDMSLADGADMRVVDAANPCLDDVTYIKGSASLSTRKLHLLAERTT